MKVLDEASPSVKAAKHLGYCQCVLLVLAIDLGGLASSLWQNILLTGIYSALIMFFSISLGFLMLHFSLSELVGIVPFSGGNFGFVRCALGPFWGFLAACMEGLYYCMYNARCLSKISLLVEAAGAFPPRLQPLWGFLAMSFVLLINIRGGLTFWSLMMLATLFTIGILMIFYVGTYSDLDFKGYALGYNYSEQYHNDGFIGNGQRYMLYVVRVMIFYLGLDILPLCSLRVVDESRVIPRAVMTSFAIVFVFALLAIFGVACHYPGVHPSLGKTLFVIQYGLADATNVNPKYYPLLLLPPTLASATGYLFAAGNQLAAMSESGLMPSILQPRFGPDQIPVVAMAACGIAQFVVYYMIHVFEPKIIILSAQIWSISAPWLFFLICSSFIAFRVKFSTMKRNFVSPFGVPGAVYGALCWLFMAAVNSYHEFQPNTKAIKAFYIFLAIMVVYYFAYVRHVQFFSKEEQEKFMKVYTLNANRMRRLKSVGAGRPLSLSALWHRVSDGPLRRFSHRGSYSSSVSSSTKERTLESSLPTGSSSMEIKPAVRETTAALDHPVGLGTLWSCTRSHPPASVVVDGFSDLANVDSTDCGALDEP